MTAVNFSQPGPSTTTHAPIVLGLETSRSVASAALVVGESVVGRCQVESARRVAAEFPVAVERLLADASVRPSELACVAVNRGPGGFTGLRVGITFARMLAWGAGVPLVGVEMVECVLAQIPGRGVVSDLGSEARVGQVRVLFDALRGDVFEVVIPFREVFARNPDSPDGEQPLASRWGRLRPAAEIAATLTSEDFLVGDRSALEAIAGDGSAPSATRTLDWDALQLDAVSVATVARHRLKHGPVDDEAFTLTPLYLRPSAATEKQHQSA